MNELVFAHWVGVAFHYAALLLLAGFALWMADKMLRGRPPAFEKTETAASTASVMVQQSSHSEISVGACYQFADSLSFGRSPTNDIIINEPYVSHEHACIIQQRRQYVFVDLGSRNGSIINGKPCEKDTVLTDGDVIGIGSVSFIFKR